MKIGLKKLLNSMSKKIILLSLIILALICVFRLTKEQACSIIQADVFCMPEIRSEVFGEVYPGDLYTTLINLQKLEPFLPSSTPYSVVLNADGTVQKYHKSDVVAIDYQRYEDGSYSVGNFGGEYREKTGGYDLYTKAGELITRFTVKDNPDTDIHGIIKLKNGNFIIQIGRAHV